MNPNDIIHYPGVSRQHSTVSELGASSPSIVSITSPISFKPQLLIDIRKYGPGLGEIKDPLGVATLPNGDIVVSEWGNKRLQIFDIVGKPVTMIGQGQIGPQGVAVTLKVNKPNGYNICRYPDDINENTKFRGVVVH